MRSRIFHQNNHSLVFQFIVSEYLTICQLFKPFENGLHQKDLGILKETFITLIGPQKDPWNLSSAYFDLRLLSKLQNCCKHFAGYEQEYSQFAQKLEGHLKKISQLCFKAWKIIEEADSHPSNKALMPLVLYITNIQKYLKKMGRLIAKLFLQFEDNEAVLLFLLQNHHAIDSVYQPQFVVKLFSKLFAKGISEAEKYIIKQYSRRGYHQLLPQITDTARNLQTKRVRSQKVKAKSENNYLQHRLQKMP